MFWLGILLGSWILIIEMGRSILDHLGFETSFFWSGSSGRFSRRESNPLRNGIWKRAKIRWDAPDFLSLSRGQLNLAIKDRISSRVCAKYTAGRAWDANFYLAPSNRPNREKIHTWEFFLESEAILSLRFSESNVGTHNFSHLTTRLLKVYSLTQFPKMRQQLSKKIEDFMLFFNFLIFLASDGTSKMTKL